jgi:hypothetical protein
MIYSAAHGGAAAACRITDGGKVRIASTRMVPETGRMKNTVQSFRNEMMEFMKALSARGRQNAKARRRQ